MEERGSFAENLSCQQSTVNGENRREKEREREKEGGDEDVKQRTCYVRTADNWASLKGESTFSSPRHRRPSSSRTDDSPIVCLMRWEQISLASGT
jgi:hypothetical protein